MTSPGTTAAVADRGAEVWFSHIDYLARVIGPRGSATEAEAEAARYAGGQFERAGLAPQVERFRSAVSAWHPFALTMAIALAAVAVYPLAGRVTAAIALVLAATVAASTLREINLLSNPLRLFLPRRGSQNVWAIVPPAEEPKRRVVVVGHLDSHRTPLLFRSLRWQRLMHVIVPAGCLAMVAAVVLFAIGLATQATVVYLIAVSLAAVLAPLLLLMLQADLPFGGGMDMDEHPPAFRELEEYVTRVFPGLAGVQFTHRWGGPVSVPVDLTPAIGFLGDERVVYSLGCVGHGVSLTQLNGRTIADLLLGRETDLTSVFFVDRRVIPWPPEPLRFALSQAIRGYMRLEDAWYERKASSAVAVERPKEAVRP